jgi:hypothetical protein
MLDVERECTRNKYTSFQYFDSISSHIYKFIVKVQYFVVKSEYINNRGPLFQNLDPFNYPVFTNCSCYTHSIQLKR